MKQSKLCFAVDDLLCLVLLKGRLGMFVFGFSPRLLEQIQASVPVRGSSTSLGRSKPAAAAAGASGKEKLQDRRLSMALE